MTSGILAVLLCASLACGQTFEVASVKPSASDAKGQPMRGGPGSGDPESVTLAYIDLARFIDMAYGVNSYQVAGPDWLRSEHFDIAAKLAPGTTVQQYRAMLQNLLATRFKLAVHREQKAARVFDLVAKSGSKLKEATVPAPTGDGSLQPGFGPPNPPTGYTGKLTLFLPNCSMDQFAARLSGLIGQPVSNATGLNGAYEIRMQYSLAGLQVDDPSATIFDAVQELGVKLTPRKGTIEMLAIDHIEKAPTRN
jgi:uncharacterized protein (TIGR03435 family)